MIRITVNSVTYTSLLDSFNNVRIVSVEQFVAECVVLNRKMISDVKT